MRRPARLHVLQAVLVAVAVAVMTGPNVVAAKEPCSGPAYDLAKRFTGSWREYTVTDQGETLLGDLTTRFEVGGCALLQSFRSADGSFTFLSFGYVDPATKGWYETYVLSNGRVASYRWRDLGREIVIDRVAGGGDDRRRLRVVDFTRDRYDVIEERSTDGGRTWRKVDLVRTRRVDEAAPTSGD